MIHKKNIFLLFMLLFSAFIYPTLIKAQVKNSVYSMFGVGKISDNTYGMNHAFGGTGIAFQSGRSINYCNPASYLGIASNSINLELGINTILNRVQNSNTTQTDTDVNFSYCSWSIAFSDRWAVVLGITPYSSIDYHINSTDQVEGEPISFDKEYSGSGGLGKAYFGQSFYITKGLSIGINTSLILGQLKQMERALNEGSFAGYQLETCRSAHSFHMDLGLQYSIHKSDWQYTIGLIYGPGEKLSTTDEITFTYNDEITALDPGKQKVIRIPENRGVGLAIKKGDLIKAGFDYNWEHWSTINFSNPNLDTKNSHRFSFGLEYIPGQKKVTDRCLAFRLGAHYKATYLEIDDTPINAMGIVIGLGIPNYRTVKNDFNVSLEYGREGTLDQGLMRNHYLIFNFSLSFHEFFGYGRGF